MANIYDELKKESVGNSSGIAIIKECPRWMPPTVETLSVPKIFNKFVGTRAGLFVIRIKDGLVINKL